MQASESAEAFVRERYAGSIRENGVSHLDHLRGIVTRLKSLGISDHDVIAAAWLQGIMNDTSTTFEEIDKRFGSRIAVLVIASFKDYKLPKDQIEKQYVKQLKASPIEVKLIKLCDISTSLKDLKNSSLSKTKRARKVKKELHYLGIMKQELSGSKTQYHGIQNIINGINETITPYGQKPIAL